MPAPEGGLAFAADAKHTLVVHEDAGLEQMIGDLRNECSGVGTEHEWLAEEPVPDMVANTALLQGYREALLGSNVERQ